jgi:hypothetical protein
LKDFIFILENISVFKKKKFFFFLKYIHLGATESRLVPAVLQIRQFVAEPEHVKHRGSQGEHYAAPVS